MVSFDICAGNPGAMTFLMQAYATNPFKAERAFQRMQDNGITGSRLYMLWNDCCDRDTAHALKVMLNMSVENIVRYINYEGGRGIKIPKDTPAWWLRAPLSDSVHITPWCSGDAADHERDQEKRDREKAGLFLP